MQVYQQFFRDVPIASLVVLYSQTDSFIQSLIQDVIKDSVFASLARCRLRSDFSNALPVDV